MAFAFAIFKTWHPWHLRDGVVRCNFSTLCILQQIRSSNSLFYYPSLEMSELGCSLIQLAFDDQLRNAKLSIKLTSPLRYQTKLYNLSTKSRILKIQWQLTDVEIQLIDIANS